MVTDITGGPIKLIGNASIEPSHLVTAPVSEPPAPFVKLIHDWQLTKHQEGGYFKETDRSPLEMTVHNGGPTESTNDNVTTRSQSTMIYYLLTPDSPVGKFHKNKSRSLHVLQRGKGQYVLIHPSGQITSFKVGFDYSNGELSQWVVPGGVYKASFLLPNEEFQDSMLISEVVVPGFEFEDHDFMSGKQELADLVGSTEAKKLEFLV